MKCFSILFLVLFVACGEKIGEEEQALELLRFEVTDASSTLDATETNLLKEFCLALDKKAEHPQTSQTKKIKYNYRNCSGLASSDEFQVEYKEDEFQIKNDEGYSEYNNDSFKIPVTNEHSKIKALCDLAEAGSSIPKYELQTSGIAVQYNVRQDVKECYYNQRKSSFNEDGICLDIVEARKTDPQQTLYDEILARRSFVLFKAFSSQGSGVLKYQLHMFDTCPNSARNKSTYEEIYLGP